ncbi:Uncharacterised protein [uncultured archaeon]|nr:Uncharacterised protein [uncultured archaeon]
MLDHIVVVGDADVSEETISIKVQDQIETDSDPGKITVVLANRLKKGYTTAWPPQTTPMKVIIKNWVYDNDAERALAGGHGEETYLVAYGHVTDISRNHEEITVTGECDLGHLADAIGQNYDSSTKYMNPKVSEVLQDVLELHKDLAFQLHYYAQDLVIKGGKKYNSDETFQDVLEDLRSDVGAVYYFSEDGVLQFRDPTAVGDTYELDPYVTNPDDTSSIMGYRNKVTVIGSQSKSLYAPTTPGSDSIHATAQDDESIDELGVLAAPTDRALHCKTIEDCQKRADLLLNFYKLFKNALTKPKVAGIIPPLHSMVSYSVSIPISETEVSSGIMTGTVVGRSIDYSIDGLETELTVAPGVADMEEYIGDEEIADFIKTFGEDEE